MAAPVNPFPNYVPAALTDGDQIDASFATLYNALDRSKVGLDAASVKDGMLVPALLVIDPWQSVTLGGPTWSPNTLEFYKDSMSIVRIKPKAYVVSGSDVANAVLATLPAGWRPGVTSYIRYVATNGANGIGTGSMSIDTAGVIRALGTGVGPANPNIRIVGGVFRAEN
jgi:hypothetical protein